MTMQDLYRKGWTIRGAARALGVSANHISLVLRGERRSQRLESRLQALPQKVLNLRERVAGIPAK